MKTKPWVGRGISVFLSDEDDYECTEDNGVVVYLTFDQVAKIKRAVDKYLISQSINTNKSNKNM